MAEMGVADLSADLPYGLGRSNNLFATYAFFVDAVLLRVHTHQTRSLVGS